MNTLQDSAMLVALNISSWGNRKHDKAATREINQAHGAKNAGRFNKMLIDEEALRPLTQIEGSARQHHYSMTSPWGEFGERILPAMLFMEYAESMDQFKRDFERRVGELHADYPRLVQEARANLGTLYNPADYPADVRGRFGFKITFGAITSADDFRVQLNEEYVNQIRQDITAGFESKITEATNALRERVLEVVGNVADVCSKEKPRIYESMMEKVAQLAQVLPALNISKDPKLDLVSRELKELIAPTERLKRNIIARQDAARKADHILMLLR